MPDNIGMTETTQMAMIGELRKVLKRWDWQIGFFTHLET